MLGTPVPTHRPAIAGSRPLPQLGLAASLDGRSLPVMPAHGESDAQPLERRFKPEVVDAVDRVDIDAAHFGALQHINGDGGAGSPARPHLAIKVGQTAGTPSAHANDDIAALQAGLLCRPAGCNADNLQATTDIFHRHPEPGVRWSLHAPLRNQVAEYRT